MKISNKDIEELAKLSMISLSTEEINILKDELEDNITHFKTLSSYSGQHNTIDIFKTDAPLRSDEITSEPMNSGSSVLKNKIAGYISVPSVL